MITKFKEIWGKTDDIILRYPMVLTTALIAAISSVVAIEIDHQDNQFLVTKLAFAGCLGISLMFGIKMLSQRIGKGFLLEILGAAFLVWFYFYLFSGRNISLAFGSSIERRICKILGKSFLQNFLLHAYSIIGFTFCSDFYQNFRVWLYRTEIFRFVIGNLAYHSRFLFYFLQKSDH